MIIKTDEYIYSFSKGDFFYEFLENFINISQIEFCINEKDFNLLKNKMKKEINNCLISTDYFNTNRKKISRIKNISYNGNSYILNLSEPKHYYFYNLVTFYDSLKDKNNFSISFGD